MKHPDGGLGRWIAGLTMAGLAIAAFIISYSDGLFLVRLAGASGWQAYLYPLLPDGLIVISWVSMYEAQRGGHPRTRWAIVGIVLGACLTVAMNVAAGVLHGPLDALVDGVVPLVFFVALEILMGLVRRGRGAPSPHAPDGGAPVTPVNPLAHVAADAQSAALAALRATTAAGNPLSARQLEARFGLSRADVTRVRKLAAAETAPDPSDAAGAPEPAPPGASRPPQSAMNGSGGGAS